MTDSKLYTILATFKKIPQNRLRKYVASPYFNVNEKIVALFDVLAEHINAVKKKVLTKEIVWQSVEGSDTLFNDSRFRKHCSDLLRLVEDYLAQEIYEKKPLQKAGYLMEAVTELKLEKLINSTDRSADILTQQQSYRSAEFYYLQYYTQKNLYDMREEEDNRFDKSNVEEIISNLALGQIVNIDSKSKMWVKATKTIENKKVMALLVKGLMFKGGRVTKANINLSTSEYIYDIVFESTRLKSKERLYFEPHKNLSKAVQEGILKGKLITRTHVC